MTSASGAGPPCPVNKQILRWSCFHFGLHLVHVEWRRLQVRVLPALSTNRYYDGAVFTLVFTLSMSNDAGFRCGSSLPCQQQISPWRTELIMACTLSMLHNRYYDGAVFTLVFTLSMWNDVGFRCRSSLPCQQQISPWRTELIMACTLSMSRNRYYDGAVFTLVCSLSLSNDISTELSPLPMLVQQWTDSTSNASLVWHSQQLGFTWNILKHNNSIRNLTLSSQTYVSCVTAL